MEKWFGSSLYQIQGWTTVQESFSRAKSKDLCRRRDYTEGRKVARRTPLRISREGPSFPNNFGNAELKVKKKMQREVQKDTTPGIESMLQSGCSECRTGNGEKLSNSQVCYLALLCLAGGCCLVSVPCATSTPSTLYIFERLLATT